MLLDEGLCHDDFGFLVLRGVLCRDLCAPALGLDFPLYFLRNLSSCGVGLKPAHVDLVLQALAHKPRLHDVRVRVVADDVLDVIILPVLIRNRHDAVVRASVLRVAHGDDGIRFHVRQFKVPPQFVLRVQESFPLYGLVHVQCPPGGIIHDLPLLMVELRCESGLNRIIEVALIILVQRRHDNEPRFSIDPAVHLLKPPDDVAYTPSCGDVQFNRVSDLPLTQVGRILPPELVQTVLAQSRLQVRDEVIAVQELFRPHLTGVPAPDGGELQRRESLAVLPAPPDVDHHVLRVRGDHMLLREDVMPQVVSVWIQHPQAFSVSPAQE